MNMKSFFISPSGTNVRKIKYEVYQTFYDMTREPYETSKKVSEEDKKMLLKKDPKEFTFTFLSDLFADKIYNGKTRKSKYEVNDIIHLNVGEYYNKTSMDTTIGRLCWNKIMIDRVGLRSFFPYNNEVLIKNKATGYEEEVTRLLREDDITTDTFRKYIDHRDWLGLQLHGLITISFTEKTMKTPVSVVKLRDELFKKYDKELKEGDIVVAGRIEKELIAAMVDIIKDDPGFDLYRSGARGDINNHMKNLFIMRGGVLNPNTGKYDIMKTSFNDGLRKEDFTAASNSVVQGAYPKAVGTADSGYLAKQLMAGNQTEVIGQKDCGTERTLDFVLEKDDVKDFMYRNINDNGNTILLTTKNIDSYVGKKIHLYTPMFCTGKYLCEKCSGKQDSKFAGLDTNKIATTLTNLNMKKFHDSTLRFTAIDPDDILMEEDTKNFFINNGDDIIVQKNYFELYVPDSYFNNNERCEDLGNMINLFGVTNVGIFDEIGKFQGFGTLNLPSWNKYYVYDTESRAIELPGLGMTNCTVYKYMKGHKFCISNLLEDSANAQLFLRHITYGKLPGSIPYDKALFLWRKNQKLNKVNFGVPSFTEEVVLSSSYRYKKDPTMKFAKIAGRKGSNVSMYDYEMASIRRISQLTSTFTGITFESFDDMVTTSINRSRDHRNETESPLEELFKL